MRLKATKFVIIAIPLGHLPKGYSVRYANKTKKGRLTLKDKLAWRQFQGNRGYDLKKARAMVKEFTPETRPWLVAKAYAEPPVDGAIFAEYKGAIIGCACVLMSKIGPEYHHAYVLSEHRGKGIYKAFTKLAMEYAIRKGYNYLIGAPNAELMNFWNRISNMEVIEYEEN